MIDVPFILNLMMVKMLLTKNELSKMCGGYHHLKQYGEYMNFELHLSGKHLGAYINA